MVLCRAMVLAALALFLGAASLRAQVVATLGPWTSRTTSGAPSHTLTGMSASLGTSGFGLRASGGVSAPISMTTASDGTQQLAFGGWGTDGDLLVYPSNILTRLTRELLGPSPYLLFGAGYQSWPREALAGASQISWSYGGGIDLPLAGRLVLSAEGRSRHSLSIDSARLTSAAKRFELRLGVALRFGGGSSSRAGARWSLPTVVPLGIPGAPSGTGSSGSTAAVGASRIIPTAERYLGTKYVWGGSSPDEGFDCSGYVQYVFGRHAVRLPRASRAQATVGTRLEPKWGALLPGDLVMFAEPGESISHVAIYAGHSRIIHATSSGGKVRYDDLDTPRGQWFTRRLVAARRVTPDAAGLLRDFLDHEIQGASLDRPDRAPRPAN
jgi:hypothetical protein